MTKWASNQPKLCTGEGEKVLKVDETCSVKTLGIRWVPSVDEFRYNLEVDEFRLMKPTKRNILSVASRLFDPLGLLCPLITKAKILQQKLWKQKLD